MEFIEHTICCCKGPTMPYFITKRIETLYEFLK